MTLATGSRTFPVISGDAAERPAFGWLDAGAGDAEAVNLTAALAGERHALVEQVGDASQRIVIHGGISRSVGKPLNESQSPPP
jgi:hypothetical protein